MKNEFRSSLIWLSLSTMAVVFAQVPPFPINPGEACSYQLGNTEKTGCLDQACASQVVLAPKQGIEWNYSYWCCYDLELGTYTRGPLGFKWIKKILPPSWNLLKGCCTNVNEDEPKKPKITCLGQPTVAEDPPSGD